MKIRCIHGYFIFEELSPGQLFDFMGLFGVEIVSNGDHFTFASLADAKDYSIEGGFYLEALATKTYAGRPWEVMRANDLVYDFNLDKVIPIFAVTQLVELTEGVNAKLASGLIMPGSLTKDGERITDYSAYYISEKAKFKYVEVNSE